MIQRLYIHNFRCLENFQMLLADQPSTLLLGPNGAGKSTVALALQVFQTIGRGASRISQFIKPNDITRDRLGHPLRLELSAKLDNRLFEYVLVLELPDGFRELRVKEESLTVAGSPIFVRDLAQVSMPLDSEKSESKFLVDWHISALSVIQGRNGDNTISTFKSWLSNMLILSPVPQFIEGHSEEETLEPNRMVTNFAEWFSGLLADYPSAYSSFERHIKKFIPDLFSVTNERIGAGSRNLTVQFRQIEAPIKHNSVTLSLPFTELSDGEKCFFICATVLAANEFYGPLFCFWDEPDNYLSVNEIGYFIIEIIRSFGRGGQLVVASHNNEIVRKFPRENTFVLNRHSHLEPTFVRQLTAIPVKGDLENALILGDLFN